MLKRSYLLSSALLACLFLFPCMLPAQTGSENEPVRYVGGEYIDPSTHDGRLRPVIGVENRQVLRANRSHPGWAEDSGWTYNHAPNLAYWNGKFYLHYLSNPLGEHIAPGQTLVATSADGRNWSKPQVVFPPYELPEGGPSMMHQRMGFYVAPNGRLLVLGFHARAPRPFGKGGIGRVVREAHTDGTYGPIHFIRYNTSSGWGEKNTTYPFYERSNDTGFVEACNALLANRLIRQQWWDEDRSDDDFFAVKGAIQAFNFYHRKDGKVVGLWKWSLTALSSDEGKSWSQPVQAPTLLMDGAKVWGQRTADNRYALVYNPIDDSWRRFPLVIVTSDDGILFDNMLCVHAEAPVRRFVGSEKSFGSQYVRGIIEGNGKPPGNNMWITYSENKEDIWVSRIPVPVRAKVDRPVKDGFDNLASGGEVTDWTTYNPVWAPVNVVGFPSASNKSLELRDKDPYDYAKAVRVFSESKAANVSFRVYARQNDAPFEVEVLDRYGNRPVRLVFNEHGRITAQNGGRAENLADYSPNRWYAITLAINVTEGQFDVSIDGKLALRRAKLAEHVKSVERISFRTGPLRTEPTRRMNPELPTWKDVESPDDPVREASFNIDDVIAVPLPARTAAATKR